MNASWISNWPDVFIFQTHSIFSNFYLWYHLKMFLYPQWRHRLSINSDVLYIFFIWLLYDHLSALLCFLECYFFYFSFSSSFVCCFHSFPIFFQGVLVKRVVCLLFFKAVSITYNSWQKIRHRWCKGKFEW